jgi:hypothetical protein
MKKSNVFGKKLTIRKKFLKNIRRSEHLEKKHEVEEKETGGELVYVFHHWDL